MKYGRVELDSSAAIVLALVAAADGRSFSGELDRDAALPPPDPLSTAYIDLPCGRRALVDAADLERLSSFRWFAKPMGGKTEKFYAVRSIRTERGARHLPMHREIAGAPLGLVVDHLNGNSLDNRRQNLRICTQGDNARNVSRDADPMRGVSRRGNRWVARLCVDGRMTHIGVFNTALEASRAVAAARTKRDTSRNPTSLKVGNRA